MVDGRGALLARTEASTQQPFQVLHYHQRKALPQQAHPFLRYLLHQVSPHWRPP